MRGAIEQATGSGSMGEYYDYGQMLDALYGNQSEEDAGETVALFRQDLHDTCAAIVLSGEVLTSKQTMLLAECRKLVAGLVCHDSTTATPLWAGLGRISDDWTFLKYVDVLLEHLWD